MAVLLDTHVIIFLEQSPEQIPERVKQIITGESKVWISKASIWEMAIKIKIEKLRFINPLQAIIRDFLKGYNASVMNIKLSHIYQTQQLPLLHRDPFDRLLIAQSMVEEISIVSSDAAFDAYGIRRI